MSKSELLEIYLEKNPLQEKRLFTCSQCPYRTDRRNNLKRHTSTMHEQTATVLECCGSRFANKASLRHHTAAFHRHGYICSICGRVFCRRALLRRHHAVHSGFKEFTCHLCDYATSHKSNLERHMKIHEDGEKYSSTSSLQSTGQSSHLDRSSPEEEDYYNKLANDSSSEVRSNTPSRAHNPILASLLSQPAHGQVFQWVYASPYDSYTQQLLNSAVVDASAASVSPPLHQHLPLPLPLEHHGFRWTAALLPDADAKSHAQYLRNAKFGWIDPTALNERPTVTTTKEAAQASKRHTIEGILAKSYPTPPPPPSYPADILSCPSVSSNSWPIAAHSTPSPIGQFSPNKGDELNRGAVATKRQWKSSTTDHPVGLELAPVEVDRDVTYVPKKLRMSKRYQSLPSQ